MSLRSVASAALLPPSSLALSALLGLLLRRRWPRFGGFIAWVSVLALVVLAMPITGGMLIAALERDLPLTPPADAPPQAIVILGGDVARTGGDPPTPFVGVLSLDRLRAGAALARRTSLPILVSGGTLREGETPIATLMADSLRQDFGVKVRWTEAISGDTWDNARMTAAILQRDGIHSVYVVTQAWHMRRAVMAFTRAGMTVTAAPTRMDHPPTPEALDFVPDVSGWQTSYFALHEWIGLAFYALR